MQIRALPIRHIWPGHHELHIPVSLLERIDDGFEALYQANKLRQGSGIFDFGDFKIHL